MNQLPMLFLPLKFENPCSRFYSTWARSQGPVLFPPALAPVTQAQLAPVQPHQPQALIELSPESPPCRLTPLQGLYAPCPLPRCCPGSPPARPPPLEWQGLQKSKDSWLRIMPLHHQAGRQTGAGVRQWFKCYEVFLRLPDVLGA